MESRIDWQTVRANPPADWTAEELKLAELLARGLSTPDIARTLGQHRSMIWRKVQRLKSRIAGSV